MAAAKSVTLTFTKDRETKGTFRYQEDNEEVVIGTLYVKKAAVEALGLGDTCKIVLSK